MWWTRLDVGRIARRIVPRIDFLQPNRRNASKLGQKESIFSRKCGTGRHRDLGGGSEGEGITSPISLLTTSLPSIRMVTSSLALSQADDQIIFVKINYNNSTSEWERTKSQPIERIKIYISLNPAVHIFMNGGEWYEAAAMRPHTFFPGFAFLIIPAAPPQWKYKSTCNVQRLTVQFVGPHYLACIS